MAPNFLKFFQCCGSWSGIRCLFDSWIRDPGWVETRKSASGSGMRDEQPGPYFLELRNHFFLGFLGLKYSNSLMRIRDPEWRQIGSGIEDKHPGSATLNSSKSFLKSRHWQTYRYLPGRLTCPMPQQTIPVLLYTQVQYQSGTTGENCVR